MSNSKVTAASAFSWFVRAVEAAAAKPLQILGGSVLGLIAMLLVIFVLALLAVAMAGAGAQATRPDPVAILTAMVPMMLFALVAGPWLMAGIAVLFHETAPAPATRVFAGLSDGRALALAGLAIIPVVAMLLSFAGYRVFGGPHYIAEYMAMFTDLRSGTPPVAPVPDHPVLLFFWGLAVSMAQYLLQMLTVPQVQIGKAGPLQAIGQSALAILRQPAASLMAIVVLILIGITLLVVLVIGGLVFALLAALSPWLALLLGLPVLLLLLGAMLAVFGGVSYYAWLDLMAPTAADAAPGGPSGIEV